VVRGGPCGVGPGWVGGWAHAVGAAPPDHVRTRGRRRGITSPSGPSADHVASAPPRGPVGPGHTAQARTPRARGRGQKRRPGKGLLLDAFSRRGLCVFCS
jgi:hypothetical protein